MTPDIGLSKRADLRVGIIDLMPPSSGGAALQQFVGLVRSALGGLSLRCQIVTISCAPGPVAHLPSKADIDWRKIATLDAMIVTGTEPQSKDLGTDPSLAVVDQLIDATSEKVTSTIFSCFSAHAAINILYSIPRDTLCAKHCGVFRHYVCDHGNPLTDGMNGEVWAPHSRWNRIEVKRLIAAGVVPLILDESYHDWHIASTADGLKYIFVQGHPEYRTDMLFREYRRDVRRFLSRETEYYPALPTSYFDDESAEQLLDFQKKASKRSEPGGLDSFPAGTVIDRLRNTWTSTAQTFVKNWLLSVTRGRTE
ncbi:MAG: homoserine O-succinyltransferase [Actinomycetota bacterium]|nr:homoserine O-succinyltransferase [Actinomycetota bacterium]